MTSRIRWCMQMCSSTITRFPSRVSRISASDESLPRSTLPRQADYDGRASGCQAACRCSALEHNVFQVLMPAQTRVAAVAFHVGLLFRLLGEV